MEKTRDREGKTKGQVGVLYSVAGKEEPIKSVLAIDLFAEVMEAEDIGLPPLMVRH